MIDEMFSFDGMASVFVGGAITAIGVLLSLIWIALLSLNVLSFALWQLLFPASIALGLLLLVLGSLSFLDGVLDLLDIF